MTPSQQQNSLICPGCRRLISRSEGKCPYCGLSSPSSWWKNNWLAKGLADPDKIVLMLIYANVAMYVFSMVLMPRQASFSASPTRFLSPSNQSLLLLGSTGTVAIGQLHRWWSLVSANYLHGGLLHLLFNMMALRQLGVLVIREYGGHRMLTIYTVGGVCGFILSYFAGVRFTVGASAAICALIGAMLYFGKSRGGHYGNAVYSQIGGWAMIIFLFGLIVPGINNWGHGGGMAAGVGLAYVLGYKEQRRDSTVHKYLGITCIVLTALVLLWAIASAAIIVLFTPGH